MSNLSLRLGDLGRPEALAAIQEAVSIRRELAVARPGVFRPDLADSLNNLSTWLGGLGRREEALAAIQESAGVYRELAEARPDVFRPDLAMSLNHLSLRLGAMGRREEALAAVQEAAEVYRVLAGRWPDVYHSELERSMQIAFWLESGEDLNDAPSRGPKK